MPRFSAESTTRVARRQRIPHRRVGTGRVMASQLGLEGRRTGIRTQKSVERGADGFESLEAFWAGARLSEEEDEVSVDSEDGDESMARSPASSVSGSAAEDDDAAALSKKLDFNADVGEDEDVGAGGSKPSDRAEGGAPAPAAGSEDGDDDDDVPFGLDAGSYSDLDAPEGDDEQPPPAASDMEQEDESEDEAPRRKTRRTPGRKTPGRKTPGRKTPARKTPASGRGKKAKKGTRKTPSRTPARKTPQRGKKRGAEAVEEVVIDDEEADVDMDGGDISNTGEGDEGSDEGSDSDGQESKGSDGGESESEAPAKPSRGAAARAARAAKAAKAAKAAAGLRGKAKGKTKAKAKAKTTKPRAKPGRKPGRKIGGRKAKRVADVESDSEEGEDVSALTAIGKVISPMHDRPVRSKRRRWKPLKYWQGEHKTFKRTSNSLLPEVDHAECAGIGSPALRAHRKKRARIGRQAAKKRRKGTGAAGSSEAAAGSGAGASEVAPMRKPKGFVEADDFSVEIPSIDGTVATLDCVRRLANLDMQPLPITTDRDKAFKHPAAAAALFNTQDYTTGMLKLVPASMKDAESAGAFSMVFSITSGQPNSVEFVLNGKRALLGPGDQCVCPPQSVYSFRNHSKKLTALVVFMLIKTGTFAVSDE